VPPRLSRPMVVALLACLSAFSVALFLGASWGMLRLL
jgi:hypothetical protein